MLSVSTKTVAKERALAERALALFLSTPNLAWDESYQLAAFERTALPVRFQRVVKAIARGESFIQATKGVEEVDVISRDVEERAWQIRAQVER